MHMTVRIEEPIYCGFCRHRMSASDIISVLCDYDEPAVVCRFRCPGCGSAFTQEPCHRDEDPTDAQPVPEVNEEEGRFRTLISKLRADPKRPPPPGDEKE